MIRTRKQRTNVFREQIEHEWEEKFWKFVEDNPDKPWDWIALSRNPNITFDIVQTNPDKPWDWNGLSMNPNITFDNVLSYPEQSWNWYGLSQNPNITIDNVLSHSEQPWNWSNLSDIRLKDIRFKIYIITPKYLKEKEKNIIMDRINRRTTDKTKSAIKP